MNWLLLLFGVSAVMFGWTLRKHGEVKAKDAKFEDWAACVLMGLLVAAMFLLNTLPT